MKIENKLYWSTVETSDMGTVCAGSYTSPSPWPPLQTELRGFCSGPDAAENWSSHHLNTTPGTKKQHLKEKEWNGWTNKLCESLFHSISP